MQWRSITLACISMRIAEPAGTMKELLLFMELRQQGVEHLGQVRLGLLETDGDISLYFYGPDDTRPGLSEMPV